MNLDPSDRGKGLYQKYRVERLDGRDLPGQPHHGCALFVLDMDHDPHACRALRAYAVSCEKSNPQLALELLDKATELARKFGITETGIGLEPLVASRTNEPFVRITWEERAAVLDGHQAMDLAGNMLQCLVGAEHDAALIAFLTRKDVPGSLGLPLENAALFLREFREFRMAKEEQARAAASDGPPREPEQKPASKLIVPPGAES